MSLVICQACKHEKIHYGKGLCRNCYKKIIAYPKYKVKYSEYNREYGIKYRKEHQEQLKEKNRQWRENHRNESIEYGRQYREQHREVISQRIRALRKRCRNEMIEAYGGCCACCGETELEFLTLDHIFGGGTNHYKRLKTSQAILRELKRQGWPKENYQLLCANCNTGKYRLGICPHKNREVN